MTSITERFEENIRSVDKLIHFDREILDIAISSIRKLRDNLVKKHKISYGPENGTGTLELLENVRGNDSLKTKYSTINNQAVVLLVSYFGSAIADLFRDAAKCALSKKGEKNILDADFKLKVSEVIEFSKSPEDNIGDLLISKVGISFQDMKSIQREFKKFFSIEIVKDTDVNNIIVGHACRHTIAHEGAIVNKRVLNQVQNAKPRTIKSDLKLNDTVSFSQTEISTLSDSMLAYVRNLEGKVIAYRENS
jgi:hypothetical protein